LTGRKTVLIYSHDARTRHGKESLSPNKRKELRGRKSGL